MKTGGRNGRCFAEADRLMREALGRGVFPGAVLLVARGGRVLKHAAYGVRSLETGSPVTLRTVWDLASLTKPLATVPAVLRLAAERAFGLESPLSGLLPPLAGTDKAGITVAHLLTHTAGLPAWRPYYRRLAKLAPAARRDALRALLAAEPLVQPPGRQTVYSDLGFMFLQWLVEETSGRSLADFVTERVYRPLGVADLFFVDTHRPPPRRAFAATEHCRFRGRLLVGEVHDENAWAVGGVAGWAGLFGTAAAVHRLLAALVHLYHGREGGHVLPPSLVQRAFRRWTPGGRALGFDCPAEAGASCGSRFSPESVGHLGFTGTSFWIDLPREIVVVLLTNRVHPRRRNRAIRAFRPRLHEAVMKALLGGE